ncbi:MAG: hypothetical protein R2798_11935 [Chitinophagales bacterium]
MSSPPFSSETDAISHKKPLLPVQDFLLKYLSDHNRVVHFDIHYRDLLHFEYARPLYDRNGVDTLWETVQYKPSDLTEIYPELTRIYADLRTEGDTRFHHHLRVDRVDFCTFGNTKPFRVRIVNKFNDNYDYFYIKIADASRIYGLELEHILSPNRINYMFYADTLIEEHIPGIPGDAFVQNYIHHAGANPVRIAKEFVKFNERCMLRLLGDMRAYNFVVDITPDFDDVQYRIRAIDFDQQCYEGRKSVYMPYTFKENRAFLELVRSCLNETTISQYQREEQAMMAMRVKTSEHRLHLLEKCALQDQLSTPSKTKQLREELAKHYHYPAFLACNNMADILTNSLGILLTKAPKNIK